VYCDVHHLRHKQDGGETTLDNLVLLWRQRVLTEEFSSAAATSTVFS
jgi:HNH endonuclease